MTSIEIQDLIELTDAPEVPGLRFRRFRGDEDFPRMVQVIAGSSEADRIERVDTVEQVRGNYERLNNCDPYTDMVFMEIDGQPNDGVIGYSRGMWWQEEATKHRIYATLGFMLPQWRRKGIGRAVLKHLQKRMREVAAHHPQDGERFFHAWATNDEIGTTNLLLNDGYTPVSHGAIMVRPDLENIPDVPLPAGFEVRPVTEEQLRTIWQAEVEAFRDHWGFHEDEATWENFLHDHDGYEDYSLWRVAWNIEKNEVAGMVRSFINPLENEQYHRKRGWTESISTRRPYRRIGLARALIMESLRVIKERGMEEGALGVHVENPNGAFSLYESCGFQVTRMNTDYRKTME
jgi:mycothiol synthase